jgi:hypothetical protein
MQLRREVSRGTVVAQAPPTRGRLGKQPEFQYEARCQCRRISTPFVAGLAPAWFTPMKMAPGIAHAGDLTTQAARGRDLRHRPAFSAPLGFQTQLTSTQSKHVHH